MSEKKNIYLDLLQGRRCEIYKGSNLAYIPHGSKTFEERYAHDISPPANLNEKPPIPKKGRNKEKEYKKFLRSLLEK